MTKKYQQSQGLLGLYAAKQFQIQGVSDTTREAVERALCGEDPSQGALYFVAPAYANPENLQWFRNSLTLLFAYHGHEFYV